MRHLQLPELSIGRAETREQLGVVRPAPLVCFFLEVLEVRNLARKIARHAGLCVLADAIHLVFQLHPRSEARLPAAPRPPREEQAPIRLAITLVGPPRGRRRVGTKGALPGCQDGVAKSRAVENCTIELDGKV